MTLRCRGLAALLAALSAGWIVHFWPLAAGFPTWPLRAIGAGIGLILALTVVALVVGSAGARRAVAAASLIGVEVTIAFDLLGMPTVRLAPTRFLTVVTGLAVGAAIVGLIARWRWARWLAVGLAGSVAVFNAFVTAKHGLFLWPSLLVVASSTIVLNLAGAEMGAAERDGGASVWNTHDPLVTWLRVATVGALIAIPLLAVYQTTAATALAAWLGVFGWFTIRGRSIGAVGMAAGGCALLVYAIAEIWAGATFPIAWLPAGLAGPVAGALLFKYARRR